MVEFTSLVMVTICKQVDSTKWVKERVEARHEVTVLEGYRMHEGMFSGVTPTDVKTPSKQHLLYVMKSLRDRQDSKSINATWWFDTRDMVCDAMTKGNISRDALLKLWRISRLELTGDTPEVWRSMANTDGSEEPTVEETEITRSLCRLKL